MRSLFPTTKIINPLAESLFQQNDGLSWPPPPPPGDELLVTEMTGVYITTEDGIFLATEGV